MTITDSASADAVVGSYTLTFDASQASGGTLASVTTLTGAVYDAATGTIPLAVGGGAGKALATMVGVIGGAAVGDNIEGAPVRPTAAPSAVGRQGIAKKQRQCHPYFGTRVT